MKLNILMMSVVAVVFTGCVSTNNVKIKEDVTAKMSGKTIVSTLSTTPDFTAMTAGKAAFGVLGAMAMIDAGNEIVKKNNIEDPAYNVGEKLAKELASKRGLKVSSIGHKIEDDSLDVLTSKFQNKDYILDIRTINWSFAYFPTDWDNYRIIYSSKLRLIDVHNKAVIAEGFCSLVPDQTEASPSYAELLASKAQRLKTEINNSADTCLKQFRKDILSL